MNRNSLYALLLVATLVIAAAPFVVALADPPASPSTLTEVQSSRFNGTNYPSKTLSAEAGNISEISVYARSPTKSWQGYFGNITGTIVLEDALGFTFYDWYDAEPKGEIFASTNGSVLWDSIHCFNFTGDGAVQINVTSEEARYGIPDLAIDGINETFNDTEHQTFYVGPVTIAQNTCPATYVYQSNARQKGNFVNVLLTDNTSLVYTTLIEEKLPDISQDKAGYNGMLTDFQMLVAEDGHTTASGAILTTYYFWVELS